MENLMQPNANVVAPVEAEMNVEQFTAAVKAAAIQIQSGINAVWVLGTRAVKMAYGGSIHAKAFCEVLLNELPSDAARQTHDWLKKAGITVNRPLPGSKLYWLSSVTRKLDEQDVEIVTAKKPGEDGFGLAKEKAIEYVKTTPPMALVKKEAKARAPKVLVGAAKNRAREAMVKTMKRLQKDDLEAARELNEIITSVDNTVSAFYDNNGLKQALDDHEVIIVRKLLTSLATGSTDAETMAKVLSGEYKVVLEAA